jgi:hypothetical protein
MTAAKSKIKRPEDQKQTTARNEKPKEKATSSRQMTIKKEEKREETSKEDKSQGCTGEC